MVIHIIGGRRTTERNLGYVADYCPICCGVRAFRLVRVGSVSHLYYISFGAGKHIGDLIRCQECGCDFDAEPSRYFTIDKKLPPNLSELVQSTFPALEATYGERLSRDAEIRSAPRALSPNVRRDLLIEPFRYLHGAVDARCAKSMQVDKPTSIGCLATTLVTIGIGVVAAQVKLHFKEELSDDILMAAPVAIGIGGIYTLIRALLSTDRYIRLRILPPLARALAPLQPDEIELKETLKACRDAGWKIGSRIKPAKILAEIDRRRAKAQQSI